MKRALATAVTPLLALVVVSCIPGSSPPPSAQPMSLPSPRPVTPSPQPAEPVSNHITPRPATSTPIPSPYPTLRLPTKTATLSCDPSEAIVQLPDLSAPPSPELSVPTPDPDDFIPAPLPGQVPEWASRPPYGEGFWPNFALALIRSGPSRELWLVKYSHDSHFYVYDRVPFPDLEDSEVFIPFLCSRHGEIDFYLSAVVARPTRELTDDVHYAWRIDPATTTLKQVPTNGIECGCLW